MLIARGDEALPPQVNDDLPSVGGQAVIEGFRFVVHHRLIQSTFVIDLVAMIFGMPAALFPVLAVSQFDRARRWSDRRRPPVAPRTGPVLGQRHAHPAPGRGGDLGSGRVGRRSPPSASSGRPAARLALPRDRGRRRRGQRDLPVDDPAGHGPGPVARQIVGHLLVVVTGGPKLGDVEAGLVATWFANDQRRRVAGASRGRESSRSPTPSCAATGQSRPLGRRLRPGPAADRTHRPRAVRIHCGRCHGRNRRREGAIESPIVVASNRGP